MGCGRPGMPFGLRADGDFEVGNGVDCTVNEHPARRTGEWKKTVLLVEAGVRGLVDGEGGGHVRLNFGRRFGFGKAACHVPAPPGPGRPLWRHLTR